MNSESDTKANKAQLKGTRWGEQLRVELSLQGSSASSRIVLWLMSVLRFYRVSDWLHFLGFTMLGVIYAGQLGAMSSSDVILIVAASSGLLGYAYSLNDVFDRELENARCNHRHSVMSNNSKDVLLPVIPLLGGMVLLLQLSWTVLALGVVFFLLWTIYSYPVPRLKAIPVVSTLVNGIGFPLLFLMGFAAVRPPSFGSLCFFLALILLGIPGQLIHEVCHSEDDRLLQLQTTAVRYGARRALQGGILCLLCVTVLEAVMLGQGFADIVSVLSIGSFASLFAIVLFLEQRRGHILDLRQLRMKYRYGGILTGVVVATSFIL